jgi:ABC-type nitrate/sulfonate/bicarbonate transport system permease component
MKAARASRIWQMLLPALTVVAVVLAWEALVRWHGIAPIYLPAPSSVAVYLWRMIADGSMPYHLGITLARIFVGFALAALSWGCRARWRGSPTCGSPRFILCRKSRSSRC